MSNRNIKNFMNNMNVSGLANRKFIINTAIACAVVGWLCLGAANVCQAQDAPADMTPALNQIVTLSKGGMDDSFILTYITNSGAAYNLSSDDIVYLHKQGVSDNVIKALMQTSSSGGQNASPTAPSTAPQTAAAAAPPSSASSPEPPPVDDSSAASSSTAATSPAPAPETQAAAPEESTPPPSSPPPAVPAPAALQDNFFADGALNPSLWQAQSPLMESLAASLSDSEIIPGLAFSPAGMQMSGIGRPGQFMGIQSTESFVPPFTFSATVAGLVQNGVPFDIYLVSADLQQWLSIAGHLGGRAERGGVRFGIGPFHMGIPPAADSPEYGFWINHTGSGWPISALGNRLADHPIAGVPYTIQVSAGADGSASVTLSDSAGMVLAAQNVPVGMGPFYVVLGGHGGSTYANWQSAQLIPATPPVAAAPAIPPTPTLDYFQSQLAPYGNWVDVPGYGACWEPNVGPGWRPYYDGGHWEDTDAGWYWQSDYPWGDITFHYGRWAYVNLADDPAWVWIPGYDYAPAWVVWRHDDADGYIGWAPLPPGAVFVDGGWMFHGAHVGVDFAFGLGDGFFTYVDYNHLFFDPHMYPRGYRAFLVPHDRLAFIYRHSVIENHYAMDHGRFVNVGLPRDRMAVLTHHDIRPMAMDNLRHQDEMHNAMVRRDDIHNFNAGRPAARDNAPGHPAPNSGSPGDRNNSGGSQRGQPSSHGNSGGNNNGKDNRNGY